MTKIKVSKVPKRSELTAIETIVRDQHILIYGTCNAIKYFFKCLCLRNVKSHESHKALKREYFLNKGINKLKQDLDVVHALKTFKRSRILVDLVLSKDDQLLMES